MVKFLAVFIDQNKERHCNIYYDYDTYFRDKFSPACEGIVLIDLSRAKGKTYKERKEYIQELAIEYSNSMSEIYPISWGQLADIQEFFERYGKRYGLLREFRENAIC